MKILHRNTGRVLFEIEKNNLRYADLRYANLCGADLHGADLHGADLHGADLCGADLDFSCLPLSCKGLSIKVDDRFIAQILHHVLHQDHSQCSGGVKESIDHIKQMAISDLFTEYRDGVEKVIL